MAIQFAKLNKGSTAVYSSGGYGFFKMSKGGGGSGAVAFATDDWSIVQAESQRIALAGSADDSPYNVGDTRIITLSTNEQIKVAIMGFNHDNLTTAYSNGATKAGITIGMCDCLATTAQMNGANTNAGGWGNSAMRTRMATYLSRLPADLQAVIAPANKTSSEGTKSTVIVTSSDSLWLFSLSEIHGTNAQRQGTAICCSEGIQYDYFRQAQIPAGATPLVYGATTGTFVGGNDYTTRLNTLQSPSSRNYYNYNSYKGQGVAPTVPCDWWLRSPGIGYVQHFIYVDSTSCYSYNASYSKCVSFGFCI